MGSPAVLTRSAHQPARAPAARALDRPGNFDRLRRNRRAGRRRVVRKEWAGAGIRLNVIAQGAILTPLLERQLATPAEAKAVEAFPVPTGNFGKPEHIADWVYMMLSLSAEFLCGSVLFVDGGTDAHFRPNDWPRAVPLRGVVGYLRKFLRFSATRRA